MNNIIIFFLTLYRRIVWKLQIWNGWCKASRRHDLTVSSLDLVHPQGLVLTRSNRD